MHGIYFLLGARCLTPLVISIIQKRYFSYVIEFFKSFVVFGCFGISQPFLSIHFFKCLIFILIFPFFNFWFVVGNFQLYLLFEVIVYQFVYIHLTINQIHRISYFQKCSIIVDVLLLHRVLPKLVRLHYFVAFHVEIRRTHDHQDLLAAHHLFEELVADSFLDDPGATAPSSFVDGPGKSGTFEVGDYLLIEGVGGDLVSLHLVAFVEHTFHLGNGSIQTTGFHGDDAPVDLTKVHLFHNAQLLWKVLVNDVLGWLIDVSFTDLAGLIELHAVL